MEEPIATLKVRETASPRYTPDDITECIARYSCAKINATCSSVVCSCSSYFL